MGRVVGNFITLSDVGSILSTLSKHRRDATMKISICIFAIFTTLALGACVPQNSSLKDESSVKGPETEPPVLTRESFSTSITCEADIKFGVGKTILKVNETRGLAHLYPAADPKNVTEFSIYKAHTKKWWAPQSQLYNVRPSNSANQKTVSENDTNGYLVIEPDDNEIETDNNEDALDKIRNIFVCNFQYNGKKFVCAYPIMTKFNCK